MRTCKGSSICLINIDSENKRMQSVTLRPEIHSSYLCHVLHARHNANHVGNEAVNQMDRGLHVKLANQGAKLSDDLVVLERLKECFGLGAALCGCVAHGGGDLVACSINPVLELGGAVA